MTGITLAELRMLDADDEAVPVPLAQLIADHARRRAFNDVKQRVYDAAEPHWRPAMLELLAGAAEAPYPAVLEGIPNVDLVR